ncbi:type IX secretion system plug protein [Marinoscillum furvescens]|uniref:Uncharacterized protein DUF5103 n=1 Tax=Marinoscillum furvescens DSM 4134 TaxID=1122208 RepID=A0A3D9L6W6_MARFU|nr:type IX secretion system plug protein domain-containing protein [Marinoscillum furvescens]REE01224.1 uncharacterized protein DUF5103 [Marinoscillum furvescens DSM 4134]
MKYIPLFTIIIATTLSSCVPASTTSNNSTKQLTFNNWDYEPYVGMVQVYPTSADPQASLEDPITPLGSQGFTCKFDLLIADAEYLKAKYVHCNADWTRSTLSDIQYMNQYNEFDLDTYDFSANTRELYVHYQASLPLPTISGNYLLKVYRDGNEQDLVLTRRLVVYENRTTVSASIKSSNAVVNRRANHQINFSVKYDPQTNLRPMQDLHMVILQNHDWNTAIRDLQPTLTRPDQGYLEYHHLTGENEFPGLKEFRFFDLRSVDYRGMNVAHIIKEEKGISAQLMLDKSRHSLAYTQLNEDINGDFFLQNHDPNDTYLESEYVKVNFRLESEPLSGEVYIRGKFNNWNLTPQNQMHYNPNTRTYEGQLLLKQGYYNYCYWVLADNLPVDALEGSHYQTENSYEVLVYYRDPANNYDEVVGYRQLLSGN